MSGVVTAIITALAAMLGSGGVLKLILERADKKKTTSMEETLSKQLSPLKENVKQIGTKLNEHIENERRAEADLIRQRILRFSNDIYKGDCLSKEYFETILVDIDTYENYCDAHPEYKNEKCMSAVAYIKRTYSKCLDEHLFREYN